ncbi:hypothetical protein [Paracoccus sp. J55]|uniref:hypothetical protein n=1 Tax=Paracoccus sp. J55 TaxID=935849 RepID=UPI0009FFAF37|nr:hypothetical protein [Paracoccus sp. J55]
MAAAVAASFRQVRGAASGRPCCHLPLSVAHTSTRQAPNLALIEKRPDENIVVMGERCLVRPGCTGEITQTGGGMGITRKLFPRFGQARVIETPITEAAMLGMPAGGGDHRPSPGRGTDASDFLGVCFDQIYDQAAKFRCMVGGKIQTSLTTRAMIGAGRNSAGQHPQSIFPHVPGLRWWCRRMPVTPRPLAAAIRDGGRGAFRYRAQRRRVAALYPASNSFAHSIPNIPAMERPPA